MAEIRCRCGAYCRVPDSCRTCGALEGDRACLICKAPILVRRLVTGCGSCGKARPPGPVAMVRTVFGNGDATKPARTSRTPEVVMTSRRGDKVEIKRFKIKV